MGVAQDSFMGPLLFNILINDFKIFVPHMSLLRLYSDDTTGYHSDTSPVVLQFVVNSELSLLSFWFDQNRLLVVNNDKTQAGADFGAMLVQQRHCCKRC